MDGETESTAGTAYFKCSIEMLMFKALFLSSNIGEHYHIGVDVN
jgi:hypothetical protein